MHSSIDVTCLHIFHTLHTETDGWFMERNMQDGQGSPGVLEDEFMHANTWTEEVMLVICRF